MAARVLMSHSTKRVWMKPEVMPIIAVMGAGCAWVSFVAGRYLTASPDTQWSKSSRGSMWRSNFSEGQSWTAHRKLFAAGRNEVGHTSIVGMKSLNKWMGGSVDEE